VRGTKPPNRGSVARLAAAEWLDHDCPCSPEQILRDEVFPMCSWNLFSVAGEWSGFDPQWLEERIVRRVRRRWRVRLGFGHRAIIGSSEWKATKQMIQALRHNDV
jgi:hypothetical protein